MSRNPRWLAVVFELLALSPCAGHTDQATIQFQVGDSNKFSRKGYFRLDFVSQMKRLGLRGDSW